MKIRGSRLENSGVLQCYDVKKMRSNHYRRPERKSG